MVHVDYLYNTVTLTIRFYWVLVNWYESLAMTTTYIFSTELLSLSTRDKVGVRVLMTTTCLWTFTAVLIITGIHSLGYEIVSSNVIFTGYYWISSAVTFWSNFPVYKYVQGKSDSPKSASGRQVFKIKTEWSEYRTQGTCLLDRVSFRNKALLE